MTLDPKKQPGLAISQIYLLRAHFEHATDPYAIEPRNQEGEATLTVSFQATELEKSGSTVPVVAITVGVATTDDNKHPYSLDIAIQGIIEGIEGQENFPPLDYARVQGAGLLYPFLREAVGNITGRGRVGPLWIKPFNFVAAAAEGTSDSSN